MRQIASMVALVFLTLIASSAGAPVEDECEVKATISGGQIHVTCINNSCPIPCTLDISGTGFTCLCGLG